jgi:alpha-N-arabinofuranosidase
MTELRGRILPRALGIGNESSDCGGAMTPEDYVSLMKACNPFVLNMNPARRVKEQMTRAL